MTENSSKAGMIIRSISYTMKESGFHPLCWDILDDFNRVSTKSDLHSRKITLGRQKKLRLGNRRL